MLPILLNIPRTAEDWKVWSWSHKISHDIIRQAIDTQQNLNLTQYDLDPINFNDFNFWLSLDQEAHNDMNGALGLQGVDLETLDPQNIPQLQAWVWNHYLEHQAAEAKLGVGS